MSPRVVTFEPGMPPLGRAVVAIGVFDGVHVGHCELLTATAADARSREELALAVTFDRDPDQIVTPEAAAPQLLTLEDKLAAIKACGIDTVLVVPFTPATAQLGPRSFLDEVLGSAVRVSAIHVGEDFRFGARTSGTVDTLRSWAAERMATVVAHPLLTADGRPVTSTRIRALVSAGEVEAAAGLLGRAPKVTGVVARGRGEGAVLGFPTANIRPVPYAAVPGDGVYAALVSLEDGTSRPAAVSVGIPPTFPEARDYIEAHLIGFAGDLYDQRVSVDFVRRLREQRSFDSLDDLVAAIRADVIAAADLLGVDSPSEAPTAGDEQAAGSVEDDWEYDELMDEDSPVVEDPELLEAAERAAASYDPTAVYERVDETWVPVADSMRLSGLLADAGASAAMITAPLEASGIEYAWDPYPPEGMPSFRPGYGLFDRAFTLLVPAARLGEARELLGLV